MVLCKLKKDLTGQVIVITGASNGIGKGTARALARMNGTIILACRDMKKGLEALNEIQQETKNPNMQVLKLDLSDLQSIRDFAANFKSKYASLDILINNAGVMFVPQGQRTKDGFEPTFGTNHLGHFYLTSLLIDVLRKSAPSRIINVSSALHKSGKMHWDDLMLEKKHSMLDAYNQSKLANNLFTKGLQRRVEKDNIKVVSLHPGVIKTELGRNLVQEKSCKNSFILFVVGLFQKPVEDGIQTTLQCSLEEHNKLIGGAYYSDCVVASENSLVKDEKNWEKLWEVSEKLVDQKFY